MVYKLHKALYALTQAPQAWFNKIEQDFVEVDFKRCEGEQTLSTKRGKGGEIFVIINIYVNDLNLDMRDIMMR